MPFKKGESGNKAGRPRGLATLNQQGFRDIIAASTIDTLPAVVNVITEMVHSEEFRHRKDGASLYLEMMNYVLPKMRAVDMTVEVGEDTLEGIRVMFKKPGQETIEIK